MAELKTKQTLENVDNFIGKISEQEKRNDAVKILKMMEKVSGAKAKMWGTAIIGFGETRLKYDSGRELDWFIMGFSPRKQNFSFYVSGAVENKQLLDKLGKYKTGKGCLYLTKLADINLEILNDIFCFTFRSEH